MPVTQLVPLRMGPVTTVIRRDMTTRINVASAPGLQVMMSEEIHGLQVILVCDS
jgi:hypothetical protein